MTGGAAFDFEGLFVTVMLKSRFVRSAVSYRVCVFRYREEVVVYKEEHLRDRQLPQFYVQYMIAIINNCQTFK